ncbi:MAG: DUF979 domain-containing protein [Negativicutes bacterium]|nr:DUF979 domain-containing protein [Negativicutes bacterium]
MIVSLSAIYIVAGLLLAGMAVKSWRAVDSPGRRLTSVFWGLYALTFLAGDWLPPVVTGAIVILLALIAGVGGVKIAPAGSGAGQPARTAGRRLFVPALAIPAVTLIGTLWGKNIEIGGWKLIDSLNPTVASLGLACIAGLGLALVMTRSAPSTALTEGHRLLVAVSWAAVLPQMLATLGAVFALAGVGKAVATLIGAAIPVDNRFLVVLAYTVGMAAFTMIMGNAFAAFPVMTAGIGLPLIVGLHGGNPAILAAIGMFSGYCGTLMTPMAANFNIVPAALLELPDRHAVIRAQWPTATVLLTVNVFLMYFLVFRF